MNSGFLEKDFARSAPDHGLAVGPLFEILDIISDLLSKVAFIASGLCFPGGESLDVLLIGPRRTASTPAISVVATAPMPGIITPRFSFSGSGLPAGTFSLP
jgi:hypothetical protein